MGLLSGIDNATGWAVLQRNAASVEKAYAADGSAASDVTYFKSVARSIKTPDALLKDYRALTFVATAYGLAGQVDQTALLRKLMTEDPKAPSSLAQRLSDENYRTFATAMSMWAPPPFASQSTIDSVVANFKQRSFETAIGQDSVPLQEAAYFKRNALGLTKLSQVMADKPMMEVVRTALGIPESFKGLSYDRQVAILKPRVDMAQFATAAGVAKFIDKFLAMEQLRQMSDENAKSSPLLSLFSGGEEGQGVTLNAQLFASRRVNLLA